MLRAQTGTISIDATNPTIPIPKTLYGVFFEEINLAGEGGLYAELVRNRSFNSSTNPDFWTVLASGLEGWSASSGSWNVDSSVSPAAYRQTANGSDFRSTYTAQGSAAWHDYTLTLQARKISGSEGFLIMFNVADANNYFWWNLGGWNNATHAIQQTVNGNRSVAGSLAGSINAGQWYDIKIEVRGTTINCYLDNVLLQTLTTPVPYAGSIGLSTWNTQAEYRNIAVTDSGGQILYQSNFDIAANAPSEAVVDTSNPLNATNADALKLSVTATNASVSVANSGFFGIPLKAGQPYNLSLYAAVSAGFAGPLHVRLESADGITNYAQAQFADLSVSWRQCAATLTPTASDTNARIVVSIDRPGTAWVDLVSLFPQATYKGRNNGLRADLAGAVEDLNPAFFRFPGGCYVEGSLVANAFRWKKTVADVSARPGHWAYWGYVSTDGLGYHEYLQYCEDIGAEPLFCINAGISHGDVIPLAQMGEFVQDAVDAIEYANGPTNSTWGALRAKNGHPEPFNLKYLEIGNENGGTNYYDRYALIYDAVKAAYPDIKAIACVWGGTPTNRPFDLMDEHYYTSPATMASYATKYDSYSRTGAKVFVGEYAVTSGFGSYGNLDAALGEAAFMTGMERNCDVVHMASYAPLLCNVNMQTWKPDAIYFDNSRWFGTPAYYVQKMFANNVGTVLLPLSQGFNTGQAGSIGLSTWNTQAEFRNITVTSTNGQVLYQSDFSTSAGTNSWGVTAGTWGINSTNVSYRQTASGTDRRTTYNGSGSAAWKDYTLTLQAKKNSGSEGFLVMFYVANSTNWFWWNLGGWANTKHAIEYNVNGTKTTGPQVGGTIASGQWYDIRIAVQGGTVSCYLNNVLTQTFNFPSPVQAVASMDEATRQIILKTVNRTATNYTANIALNGLPAVGPASAMTTLKSASLADENSFSSPTNVAPVTASVTSPAPLFPVTVPAYSVNILRVQAPALAPGNLTASPGNQQTSLNWSPSAGATTYAIQRATSSGGPYTTVASGLTNTNYVDTGLSNGTSYYYLVAAENSSGATPSAAEVSGTPVLPPIAPDELQGPGVTVDGNSVSIVVKGSVPGRQYTLQRISDIQTSSWAPVGSPQVGTGGDLIFTEAYDPQAPKVFYRVHLAP